ncbi:hypothetical protein SAMN05443582_11276 [Phyllobacterium sp. OV277]|jgi:hypothetical protein|nr:hypothetical protein SAMN05443582_11276 [Phyllobacterium sp. OV277]
MQKQHLLTRVVFNTNSEGRQVVEATLLIETDQALENIWSADRFAVIVR